MLTSGLIVGAIVLCASAIAAAFPVSIGGIVALAFICAALAAGLLYYLVIAPLARMEPPAPSEDRAVLTTIDSLTRTLNRRGITSSLLESMAQAQRYSMQLSVALVSIDDFERLVDKRGQAIADRVLQGVSQTVTEVLRLPDRVGRHSNAEFLIVMPQTNITAAVKVAERIRTAVSTAAASGIIDGGVVTVSLGVAEFNKEQDLEKLLSSAQAALAQASDAGDRVVRHKSEKKR